MNIKNPKNYEELIDEMRRPTGGVSFICDDDDFFDVEKPDSRLFQIISGNHIFILERKNKCNLDFIHSTPGGGTFIATVKLDEYPRILESLISLIWSPQEMYLILNIRGAKEEKIQVKGIASTKEYRILKDSIIQLGDSGIEVLETRIFSGKDCLLEPTAIESWNSTLKAVELLHTGKSEIGYIYENIICNVTVSTLVTGFETYAKKRSVELDKEGVQPNIESLISILYSRYEKESDIPEKDKTKAEETGKSYFEVLMNKKVNFQNYDECKRVFSKGYGIKFGNIGCTSNTLTELQKIIRYRHRVIHVSPLLAITNQNNLSNEKPIFANDAFTVKAISTLDIFIKSLHNATLNLNRLD